MGRVLPQINIARSHYKVLAVEFPDYTRQTIYDALCYHNNSETARAIRKRAKELLEEEIQNIVPEAI